MAFPLLAQLALALVATKMQKDEENKARAHATRQRFGDTQAMLASKRAKRAGDSGYMQDAVAGFSGNELGPKRNVAGPMLAQLGAAYLAQDAEPVKPLEPSQETLQKSQPIYSKRGWAGMDQEDLAKWGGYA